MAQLVLEAPSTGAVSEREPRMGNSFRDISIARSAITHEVQDETSPDTKRGNEQEDAARIAKVEASESAQDAPRYHSFAIATNTSL
jgi:hypothetical protein